MSDWIDVSVLLHNGMAHWPGDEPFERKLGKELGKDSEANLSQISGSAHTGTHMDAPRHFIKDGMTIDEMPMAATVGRARVIEIKDPETIRVSEIEPYRIERGERILFKTLNSERVWKTNEFQENYIAIPPDTAKFLVERGVRTVGVDYLSVGMFAYGNPDTHRTLLGAGVWVIEGLDLAKAEAGHYDMVCLPLKMEGADGAPARAILKRIET